MSLVLLVASLACGCGSHATPPSTACEGIDCSGHGTCQIRDGAPVCDCAAGYRAEQTRCVDSNECLSQACGPNASCTNLPGSYSCQCRPGYAGDPCADVDECAADQDDCASDATCANTAGSFTCACLPGYRGDGRSCADIDECNEGLDDCLFGEPCFNLPGGFACACPAGYSESGDTCSDIDECATGSADCAPHALCTNLPGSYRCACPAGWWGDGRACSRNKVLLLALDGVRPDALAAAHTPHLDGLAAMGLFSDRAQAGDITLSGPGWTTILTGVWRDRHLVVDNDFEPNDLEHHPPLLRRLADLDPSIASAWFNSWAPMEPLGDGASLAVLNDYEACGDACTVTAALAALSAAAAPEVVFVYFAMVDVTGHAHGFHPGVPEYLAAIETADAQIGQLLTAIASRPTSAAENWLVLATGDHGGGGAGLTSHGANVPEDRTVFFLASGPRAVERGQHGEIYPPPTHVDLVPTVLAHLAVPLDPVWGLDGRAILTAASRPPAAYGTNLIVDGDAEAQRGIQDFHVDGSLTAWRESAGVSAVPYDTADTPASSAITPPATVGRNLFAGVATIQASISQRIDVGALAIGDGASFTLAADLGGWQEQLDRATLTARFRDGTRQAAFLWRDYPSAGQRRLFFFVGDQYWRYDPVADAADPGYPRPIAGNWDCLWPDGVDAFLVGPDESRVYAFRDGLYLRYELAGDQCATGSPPYPRPIAGWWPGLERFADGASDLDAAVRWSATTAYFFKRDQYIRYDLTADQALATYPRRISQVSWPGLHVWPADLDLVADWGDGETLFFFKEGWYIRYRIAANAAVAGYPRPINASTWPGLTSLFLGVRSTSVGPVTAAERGGVTGLWRRSTAGVVPPRTYAIEIELLFDPGTNLGDGYADNVSMVLHAPRRAAEP